MNNNKSFIKNQTKNKDWREMKQQWALSTGWKHQPVLNGHPAPAGVTSRC